MDLTRHVRTCTNANLPGGRHRLFLAGEQVGWVKPGVLSGPGDLHLAGASELSQLVAGLEAQGVVASRRELFDVRAASDGPSMATVDRGALPALGIMAAGVHLNGMVRRTGRLWMWVARRSMDKKLDPGKLDHIVGGGVPAGLSAMDTLLKEAEEEAALPRDLTATAVHVARMAYAMERDDGLRRDVIDAYDLELPPDFEPRPTDGEVEAFELWPIEAVVDRVRHTDDFKFNVNLVLIDLFLRLGLLPASEAVEVRRAMARVYASVPAISGGAASMGMSRAIG